MTDRMRIVVWCAAVAGLFSLVFLYARFAPAAYNLTRPFEVAHRPNILTGARLAMTKGEACYAALDRAGIGYTRLDDERFGGGCGFRNVATLDRSLVKWGGRVSLTCPMLLRLVVWERHDVLPAARKHLGAEITQVIHYGTYSCRRVNNAASGRLSEHARANAIDIAAFKLSDGRVVSVAEGWRGEARERAFLGRLRYGACGLFATVLSPDYNDLHNDHFHFDNGGFTTCR